MTKWVQAIKNSSKRLFVPSLSICVIATALSNTILTLFMLDIASTFQINGGVAAQLKTVNAAAEVFFALSLSVLAIRYKNKRLLLILGESCIFISALGSYFSPTFDSLLFFFFLEGIGTVLVTVMAYTFVGDYLPYNQRAKNVSRIISVSFVSTLAVTLLANYVYAVGGWRYAFLLMVLPVSIVGLSLVLLNVPSSKSNFPAHVANEKSWVKDFKPVFLNKSAFSCAVSGMFLAGDTIGIFSVAFFRQQFLLPREYVIYLTVASLLTIIAGSLIAGRLVNKFRVKSMTISCSLVSGTFIILTFFMSNLWVALAFNFLGSLFIGMTSPLHRCLALSQASKFRSSIMSLIRMFDGIGRSFAAAVGGILLIIFSQTLGIGYHFVGITLGGMSIIAAALLFFFTKDYEL